MPELYSDNFLATIDRTVPNPTIEPSNQPSLPLKDQFRDALGPEAGKLAALGVAVEKLQKRDRDTMSVVEGSSSLETYVLDTRKKNLPIAILYGTLHGNDVYIFLHEIAGSFPYHLTYHSFNAKTESHVSEHTGRYVWKNVPREDRAEAFLFVREELQMHALTMYLFSCQERLAYTHSQIVELSQALLSVCNLILGPVAAPATDSTQEAPPNIINLPFSGAVPSSSVGPSIQQPPEPTQQAISNPTSGETQLNHEYGSPPVPEPNQEPMPHPTFYRDAQNSSSGAAQRLTTHIDTVPTNPAEVIHESRSTRPAIASHRIHGLSAGSNNLWGSRTRFDRTSYGIRSYGLLQAANVPRNQTNVQRTTPSFSYMNDTMNSEHVHSSSEVRAYQQAWMSHIDLLNSHEHVTGRIRNLEAYIQHLEDQIRMMVPLVTSQILPARLSRQILDNYEARRALLHTQKLMYNTDLEICRERAASLVRDFNVACQEMNRAWCLLKPWEMIIVLKRFPMPRQQSDMADGFGSWIFV